VSGVDDRRRVLILGAAGRDFHCFNRVYRDDPSTEVVAFTATQIPGIEERRYPIELAGPLYPEGIPIRPESELETLCATHRIDQVVFAYSDVSHSEVMHAASRALAAGADFTLLGPDATMLEARVPVIAVSAVRTGCGKSQTSRWIALRLIEKGLRVAAIRHPMPYGDLREQRLQRFSTREDLERAHCTAEEREEYEPYVDAGALIFAGVDYAAILEAAQSEAEIIVWDGGNNDFPFLRPDLHIAVLDALRPEQVTTHHPGETVARMADVAIVNKVDSATPEQTQEVFERFHAINADAPILRAASPITLSEPERVRGRRVIVVEDGPTTTHGGMGYGAGRLAALAGGAAEIVDPRPTAAPAIREVLDRHPHLEQVVPAMGYGDDQLEALRETLEAAEADVVVSGSPIDLARLIRISKPIVRALYRYQDLDDPGLAGVVDDFLSQRGLATR
jgi:predicted GTPase